MMKYELMGETKDLVGLPIIASFKTSENNPKELVFFSNIQNKQDKQDNDRVVCGSILLSLDHVIQKGNVVDRRDLPPENDLPKFLLYDPSKEVYSICKERRVLEEHKPE